MSEQAGFALRNRNPDVLTCIANLSNDEVFTPPDLAKRMLDDLADAWAAANGGANIWEDGTIRFLDPSTKTGIFLREIASRLIEGLESQIPDRDERVRHVLTEQVFGIAVSELTSLLARRSLYCSKHAQGEHSIARHLDSDSGNVWFERTEHTWIPGHSTCSFCGANRRDYDRGHELETHAYAFIHTGELASRLADMFGGQVQFDVIIGNPPYQLGQSGGDAVGGFAMPIYQKFVEAAKSLDPRYLVMITPSRWFAGGRGLDDFREKMLKDRRLRVLVDIPDGAEAFPGTRIEGGVSYFVWDKSWDGPCEVNTVQGGELVAPPVLRFLGAYDVLIRRNEAVPILEKVLRISQAAGEASLEAKVSPIQPFSLRTNFRGAKVPAGIKRPVRVIGNGRDTFMPRAEVPRNDAWIDDWKVLVVAAYGAKSNPQKVYNAPIVAGPGTVCTETYLVVDRFTTEVEAENLARYLRTRFVRFLVSLRKNTQHIFSERFKYVPDLQMDRQWSDRDLFNRYELSEAEITFIKSVVRLMDDDD